MKVTPEMLDRLAQLEEKYGSLGQDMLSYLDGLIYADYLTYWDYIHLDTLLSLQSPKTPFPDENIFIIYHQITELYFKLILQAIELVQERENLDAAYFTRQITRVNRYFEILIDSFSVMIDGMDRDEFLQFRMSLLPSSGFQSAQYRMIEIVSTDMKHLVHHTKRSSLSPGDSIEEMYEKLYWKSGATELATGKKTLTLKQFEAKYSKPLTRLGKSVVHNNLLKCYEKLPINQQQDEALIDALKEHDKNANVRWPLAHIRSAMRYLDRKPHVIEATGGTNWQKYLPAKNQRITFYPSLWSDEELEDWGKSVK